MSDYRNMAVPFRWLGNRRYLTDEQLAEIPELAAFVAAFPKCFERVECLSIWVFIEADE